MQCKLVLAAQHSVHDLLPILGTTVVGLEVVVRHDGFHAGAREILLMLQSIVCPEAI